MLRTTAANLRYRLARLLLSALAIVASVGFVAGTLTLSASLKRAYDASFAAGAANVSAVVAARKSGSPPGQAGGQTLPSQVLAAVGAVPGVAAAAGRLTGPAPLAGSDGKVMGSGFGINIAGDRALDGFSVVSGHLPVAPGQVAVDKATAADQHFRLGQKILVVDHTGARRSFRLVATIDLGVNPQFGNATVTAFQTSAAVQVTGQARYGLIAVRAAPGISQTALAARLRSRPGLRGYRVLTGSEFAAEEVNSAVHVTRVLTAGLLIFALIALVVACIVVYNTFSIVIAQSSRELALLRCVGATRRQVFGGTLAEALTVGLVASAAGVAAGIGLSWGLQQLLVGRGSALPAAPLVLTPSAVAISLGCGVAITAVASVPPARTATRIAPVAALGSQAGLAVTSRSGWSRAVVAIAAAGAGVLLTIAGASHGGNPGFAEIAAGGCLCFVAVLALGPLFVPPVISALGWLPGRLAGPTAMLATASTRRNPHRVAATTAALSIGITLMTLLTVVVSSVQASTDAAIQGHFPFDYLIKASQNGQAVPPRIVGMLQSSPKLGRVAPYYAITTAKVNGAHAFIGAYGSGALGATVRPAMVSGSLAGLGPGSAAVDTSALKPLHTRLGGSFTISAPGARRLAVRVTAVYDSARYRSPVPPVIISAADFLRAFRPPGADEVIIDAAPGVPPAASRAAVDAATAADPLLTVQSFADYKAGLNAGISQVLDIVAALLGLAILIALLGISATLTLSVIERTRESALLRALGLTRGQLRRMLLTEALLMAALAVVLGVGLGTTFGVVMMHAVSTSMTGRGVVSMPYSRIALYAAVSACAALAAAVLPARRAARTSPVSAMAA
jgi:putative ABC transport system permease protein